MPMTITIAHRESAMGQLAHEPHVVLRKRRPFRVGRTPAPTISPLALTSSASPGAPLLSGASFTGAPNVPPLERSHATAHRCSIALDFGCVWVNTHLPLVAEMPHGGFKQSGYGKDLSMYSLEDYTQVKHVMAKLD